MGASGTELHWGGSVLEVLTDKKLRNRLTNTMKIINILEIKDFDILGEGCKKPRSDRPLEPSQQANKEAAKHRILKCIQNCRNPHAREWYDETLRQIESSLVTGANEQGGTVVPEEEDSSDGFMVVQRKKKTKKNETGNKESSDQNNRAQPVDEIDPVMEEQPQENRNDPPVNA